MMEFAENNIIFVNSLISSIMDYGSNNIPQLINNIKSFKINKIEFNDNTPNTNIITPNIVSTPITPLPSSGTNINKTKIKPVGVNSGGGKVFSKRNSIAVMNLYNRKMSMINNSKEEEPEVSPKNNSPHNPPKENKLIRRGSLVVGNRKSLRGKLLLDKKKEDNVNIFSTVKGNMKNNQLNLKDPKAFYSSLFQYIVNKKQEEVENAEDLLDGLNRIEILLKENNKGNSNN